jgi:hypothetical protein
MSEQANEESFLEISFDDSEGRFLYSLLASISQRATSPESAAAFGLLAVKVRDGKKVFSQGESDLMLRIVTATLKAGEQVKARTEDLEARVRASAVEAAYNSIKGKIENGKPAK